MVRKRLVGVITVLDGWAVQSIGYSRYLPLGRPEVLAENLDRWGADEIMILDINRSRSETGPDFELLRKVVRSGISTPVCYAGGVKSHLDAMRVIKEGAERVIVDAVIRSNPDELKRMSAQIGAQALILSLPMAFFNNELIWYNYLTGSYNNLYEISSLLHSEIASEILLIDHINEGTTNGHDRRLLEKWAFPSIPIIAFGGLDQVETLNWLLNHTSVVAVGIGNFLNYREHSIQKFKELLSVGHLRSAYYSPITHKGVSNV